jgi:predicted permease
MLRLLLELVPCLLLGLLIGRRHPSLAPRLAQPLVAWGVPVSLVGLLLRAGLRWQFAVAGGMALAGIGLGLLLLRAVPPLRRRLPGACLPLGCVVGNTAYFGVPVALALLPEQALGYTITFDLVATLIAWSAGPLLIQGTAPSRRGVAAALWNSPASRGFAMALIVQLTPWSAVVAEALWIPARTVIVLSLLVVGMRLGQMLGDEAPAPPGQPRLELALLGKLLLFPALMLLLALVLGLPPLIREAVVLQAAAPTAVSVLLLAEASGREVKEAAGLVLWSTLIALGSVPLWWWGMRVLATPLVP